MRRLEAQAARRTGRREVDGGSSVAGFEGQFERRDLVELSGAAADSFGFLHAGRSDSRLLFLRLPFDLSILGASGCMLYQSTEMIMPIRTDAMGAASREFTIPSAMARDFQGIYFQYSFVNPGSNRLGLQLTELLSVEPAGN